MEYTLEWHNRREEILNWLVDNEYTVKSVLRRNGYTFESKKDGLCTKLFTNLTNTPFQIRAVTKHKDFNVDSFYKFMRSDENRKFLKMLSEKRQFEYGSMPENWSESKRQGVIKDLQELEVIDLNGEGQYKLSQPYAKYGINLEWYVAEIFQRELSYFSDWGVHIKEAPNGGDYDVLASDNRNIIYVECKGKEGTNLKADEFIHFLNRDEFLRPYVSIFLVETTSNLEQLIFRLKNSIRDVIEKHMKMHPYSSYAVDDCFTKINARIYVLAGRLFITSTKGSIIRNLKECLRYRYRLETADTPMDGMFWLHKLVREDLAILK